MTDIELYWLSKGNVTIGATMLHGRKNPCLYIADGNFLVKYATFNSKATAKLFMDRLADFCGAVKENDDAEE